MRQMQVCVTILKTCIGTSCVSIIITGQIISLDLQTSALRWMVFVVHICSKSHITRSAAEHVSNVPFLSTYQFF